MPPEDELLHWLQSPDDSRWHLADGGEGATSCGAVLRGAIEVDTAHLPEHPSFCRTCRHNALRRLDEVA